MSRSYKKHPGWKDCNKGTKTLANRKARRPWHWDISNGMAYKKLTERWNICDWNFRYYSKAEVDREVERHVKEYALNNWRSFRVTPKYKYFMK